jgi:NAD(P)-dependent dehydrogenase (short-subunit alcohol dehydrogenase family)
VSKPVAVITGAARGIGRETARHLAADDRMALLDLDGDGAQRAVAELPDAARAQCDIADPDAVDAAVEHVVGQCGGIDVCISPTPASPPRARCARSTPTSSPRRSTST